MEIIEIEGLDKSGKNTVTERLYEYFISKGLKVEKSSFHRYDTPTGKLIQAWLYGQYDVDTETIKLIMVADKQAQQMWFKELELKGVDILLLDRYYASNLVYSKNEDVDIDWIYAIQSQLRKPDISVLLDISAETSISRKGQHGENDRYEKNLVFLKQVRKTYLEYFEEREYGKTMEGNAIILRDIDNLTKDEVFYATLDRLIPLLK